MWNCGEGIGWWMVGGTISMVVLWGTIIALVIWGISKMRERGGALISTTEKHDPLDIARARFARGDISQEEFEQVKKNLSYFGGDK